MRAATTPADPVLALEGATSYRASAVASPSGHMSHHGAQGTRWTVVAPNGLARLASLRSAATRRPGRVQGGRPLSGIYVPKVAVSTGHMRRRPWNRLARSDWTLRSGFSGARRRRVRPRGVSQAADTGEAARVLCSPAILHGRDGGVCRGTPLGGGSKVPPAKRVEDCRRGAGSARWATPCA
jgi:hypothetical protein